jgi:hypothetical protein
VDGDETAKMCRSHTSLISVTNSSSGRRVLKRSVVIVTCLVAVVAVAGCGGGSDDISSVSSTQANATTRHRDHLVPCRIPRYAHGGKFPTSGDLSYRYPGSIRPAVGPPYVGPGEMSGDSNMWWTNDCHAFTVVTAGSDGDHPGDGLLAIHREHLNHPHNTWKEIKVPDAGILEITKAPLGPSVETWAQKRGNIQFKGDGGITGTLHLSDDSVTLDPKKNP